MRYATTSLLSALLLLLFAAPALGADACPAWQAERDVRAARQALERAEKRLAEAKRVLSATRTYNAQYGTSVGRWVRLSRRVGWPWSQMPTLMYVVDRESGGNPYAKNPVSTASGLMQFLSFWWYGKWDPFDPRQNLAHGWRAVRDGGWSPWAL